MSRPQDSLIQGRPTLARRIEQVVHVTFAQRLGHRSRQLGRLDGADRGVVDQPALVEEAEERAHRGEGPRGRGARHAVARPLGDEQQRRRELLTGYGESSLALRNIKAAAMVERNGSDYAIYLSRVFADDPKAVDDVGRWSLEEVQHGMALGRWAQLADPSWDFDAAFARFRAGYQLPLDATRSVRGSQAGEMMARCIVETGTSSYYSALRDATEEPVLKQICERIAGDEFRHYKLFYDHMQRLLERDRLSTWQRLWIGWGRLAESEDDELAYAYFAANEPADALYDRKKAGNSYARRAYPLYRPFHVQRAMAMMLKAVGLNSTGRLNRVLTRLGLWFLRRRSSQLAAQGA